MKGGGGGSSGLEWVSGNDAKGNIDLLSDCAMFTSSRKT